MAVRLPGSTTEIPRAEPHATHLARGADCASRWSVVLHASTAEVYYRFKCLKIRIFGMASFLLREEPLDSYKRSQWEDSRLRWQERDYRRCQRTRIALQERIARREAEQSATALEVSSQVAKGSMLPVGVYAITTYLTIIFAIFRASAFGFLKLWALAIGFFLGGLYKRYRAGRDSGTLAKATLLPSKSESK